MREFKKLTTIKNRGINRKNVLSSGRALPSSKGWEHLARQCELQHAYLIQKTSYLVEQEPILRERIERLNHIHKRDPTRLKEVPNHYLYKQRLAIIFKEVDAAKELYDALQAQYKNATGSPWKPKPNVNEPLHENYQGTAKSPKR